MDIETTPDPAHQPNEAPVSKELRDQAITNLDTIKQLVNEAREAGTLSKEDEAVLSEWLKQDVAQPATEANVHDAERQAILSGRLAEKALDTGQIHVDVSGNILNANDLQELKSSGPDVQPTAGRLN